MRGPWPSVLPSPPAAAALVLCVLGFGVELGDALGPPAVAAPVAAPVQLALSAPVATPTPTPTAAPAPAPVETPALSAPAPVQAAAPAPIATAAATRAPTTTPAPTASPAPTPTPDTGQPAARHVFVVWMGLDPAGAADDSLRAQATTLAGYKTTGKGDGLVLASGRAPTCAPVCDFRDGSVPSIADRLAETGAEGKAYQGDACDGPVERDPLSAFGTPCAPLDQLATDLADAKTAPALSFVAPAACDAGIPDACADAPARADAFLAATVPAMLQSPTYADAGVLLVVFDGGPVFVVSPFAQSGVTSHEPYDAFALHRTIADVLGVDPLGRAAKAGVAPLGDDVWSR